MLGSELASSYSIDRVHVHEHACAWKALVSSVHRIGHLLSRSCACTTLLTLLSIVVYLTAATRTLTLHICCNCYYTLNRRKLDASEQALLDEEQAKLRATVTGSNGQSSNGSPAASQSPALLGRKTLSTDSSGIAAPMVKAGSEWNTGGYVNTKTKRSSVHVVCSLVVLLL